ncbi:MAG: mechanosensitive ion channel [Clostridia bacterium]|nr:mechanosensitive ion channel [Clostridia bacterium]
MDFLKKICDSIEAATTINSNYVYLIIISIVIILVMKLIKNITLKLSFKKELNSKEKYMYKKNGSAIITVITFVLLFIVWTDYLKSFITVITFISTAITLSLKDIIFNFFSGIYIRTSKIFSLEDRIEVGDLRGDVVNINKTSFDLLEIGDRVNGEQSTGRIVHVPNSIVFTHPVKNYVKAFKYIWDEIKISIPLDADVYKTKKELYKIIKKNSIVRNIPNKMESEVKDASADYRIYFNNLEPIIYVEVVDSHIELYLRFLVHPKKKRNVENSIWLDIIKAYKEGIIELYKKE